MTVSHSYSTSSITSALRSSPVPSTTVPTSSSTFYKIDSIRKAENASLFFTRNAENNKHVVMKILNDYKDIRYSLETVRKRHLCQLDALQWNRKFTEDVYLGLAQVADPNVRKQICIGEIIRDPTIEDLDPDAEYALLMEELPRNRRLDHLLKRGKKAFNESYVRILTQYMARIHRKLDELSTQQVSSSQGEEWGSVEQLKNKLRHNFSFVDDPPVGNNAIFYSAPYEALKEFRALLEDKLLPIFVLKEYQNYFMRRVQEQRIRRCHGDLKARNIWIMPDDPQSSVKPWKRVKVLDAVDFNPMYSTIDILSDFAMLVIDVYVRTDSCEIADGMLEDYLHLTRQEDKSARAVLNYYMVEKAFIGAILNILYDENPELGLIYLKVAKRRLEDMKSTK